jgi:hypothetical protein
MPHVRGHFRPGKGLFALPVWVKGHNRRPPRKVHVKSHLRVGGLFSPPAWVHSHERVVRRHRG